MTDQDANGLVVPVLETERLRIRPFALADLDVCHELLDRDAFQTGWPRAKRRDWLVWTIAGYVTQPDLRQLPYGDRAVVDRETGRMVGAVGLVPSLGPFGRLTGFGADVGDDRNQPQVGLFWATKSEFRNRGYATEAASALLHYAFASLNLARIVATTEYGNLASQRVMARLGMRIERNPRPDPPWFQVIGVLDGS